MSKQSATAIALALAVMCGGCGSWAGAGFRADGPEMPRLRQVLALKEGMVVADVGAGKGELTLAIAREVGSKGHVFSTEIDAARLKRLARTQRRLRQHHGGASAEPRDRTAARLLRRGRAAPRVSPSDRPFEHERQPAAIPAPGGVLVIIDMPPPFTWLRGSLGVPAEAVIAEIKASGFELVQLISDWPGRGPLGSYCAVFRRPPTRVSIHQ